MHLFLLRTHVAQVVRIRLHLYCYVLYNNYAITLQTDSFYGIICHKSQILSAHRAQNLCAYSIVPLVGIEAKMHICLHGILALLLQFVGFYFVHQPYSSTLLVEVNEYSPPFFFDATHGFVELFTAFAAFTAEYIPRHAGGVNAAQDRLILRPCAFGQYHMLQPVAQLAERRELELAVLCRQRYRIATLN